MKRTAQYILLLGFLFYCGQAAAVDMDLHINWGEMTVVDGETMPFITFNGEEEFSQHAEIIQLQLGEELNLTIHNHDTINHGFFIDEIMFGPVEILADSSASVVLQFDEVACYSYYDPTDYPKYRYMGLSGVIAVLPDVYDGAFVWDIREHDKAWNDLLYTGTSESVEWDEYYPRYFTINGNSNPDINADPLARITGNVNDEIYIFMTNNGMSAHSMHFHGYHCEILYSSMYLGYEGWVKDTFPIWKEQSVVLKLVPHQTGEYPVHDHNLVAVTGGDMYPNGMFTTILIE